MVLSTSLADGTAMATIHAAQHNEVNTDVLALLPAGTSHYAEYTISFSLVTAGGTITSGLTKVTDTDNMMSGGNFTIGAGLGGLWVITAYVEFPAANYATNYLVAAIQRGGSNIAQTRWHIASAETGTLQNDVPAVWVGLATQGDVYTLFAEQDSGSNKTVTGRISLARIGPA